MKILAFLMVLCPLLGFGTESNMVVRLHPQSFDAGGWELDAQFSDVMGSAYLLAHGLGQRVASAQAIVDLKTARTARVWVRTRNWLPEGAERDVGMGEPWPCGFRVSIGGRRLEKVFGVGRRVWHWEDGGMVDLPAGKVAVKLEDLAGFDARCAGVILQSPEAAAPEGALSLRTEKPAETEVADLVVVGGGLSGCAAAVAAARRGVRVILVQDRPVLGGNASGEIRVWSGGEMRHPIVRELRGKFPIQDPNLDLSDAERLRIVTDEKNISLHLLTRAFGVEKTPDGKIAAVLAIDLKHNRVLRLKGAYFCDATGDGWVGHWAGASWRMGREAKSQYGEELAPEQADGDTLGASIMWTSAVANDEIAFSAPWAERHACGQSATKGCWYWEYGIHEDMIEDGEWIRDRLFLAIYGAFSNAKKDPANRRRLINFCPYVLGKRESRRIVGAYMLTSVDVVNKVPFEDAVATGSWAIDEHIAGRPDFPGVDFMATSIFPNHFGRYWIPWRTLYSRDVPNLLMAGRCFSATHAGLSSPRVINTLAQLGVAVGTGVSLCQEYGCGPSGLLERDRMRRFQRILGGDWPGNPDPAKADWKYVDDEDANAVSFEGDWTFYYTPSGSQLGHLSHFKKPDSGIAIYRLPIDHAGEYDLYGIVPYCAYAVTPSATHLEVVSGGVTNVLSVDQSVDTGNWQKIGRFRLDRDAILRLDPKRSSGTVIADGFAVRECVRK